MSSAKEQEPMAQLYDRFLNRCAISMFLLALLFAYSAAEQLLGSELPAFLMYGEKAVAILILVLCGPVTVKVYMRKRSFVSTCDEPEGFLTAAFQKAAMRTFTGSFVLLMVIYVLLDKAVVDWPAGVLVSGLLAFNMIVASGSFFFDSFADSDDDFDEEPVA